MVEQRRGLLPFQSDASTMYSTAVIFSRPSSPRAAPLPDARVDLAVADERAVDVVDADVPWPAGPSMQVTPLTSVNLRVAAFTAASRGGISLQFPDSLGVVGRTGARGGGREHGEQSDRQDATENGEQLLAPLHRQRPPGLRCTPVVMASLPPRAPGPHL